MGYGAVYSRAALGVTAPLVQVEVRLSGGLPTFQVAGAAEARFVICETEFIALCLPLATPSLRAALR